MDFTNLASKHNLNIIGKPLNGIYVYNDQGYYNSQDEVPLYYVNGRRKYLSSLGNQIYTPGDRRIQDVDGMDRLQPWFRSWKTGCTGVPSPARIWWDCLDTQMERD